MLLIKKSQKNRLALSLFILSAPLFTNGQTQRADITKLTYQSHFGGAFANSNEIFLEVKPDGSVKMFNDMYDSTNINNLLKLQEGGSRTITVSEFEKSFYSDTSAFYTGKIAKTEYQNMIDIIMQIQKDTARSAFCCCDIPVRCLTVSLKNHEEYFIQCGGVANARTISLLDQLDKIAYKRGYKKSPTPLKFEKSDSKY